MVDQPHGELPSPAAEARNAGGTGLRRKRGGEQPTAAKADQDSDQP